MAKRPKVEPIRNPTLFEMDKLEENMIGKARKDLMKKFWEFFDPEEVKWLEKEIESL